MLKKNKFKVIISSIIILLPILYGIIMWKMCIRDRLRRIGIDVCRISSSGSELLENLTLMSAEDLVVLFGFSKVSVEGSVILNHQKRAGYQTLLFTSRTYHDEKHRADINLFVYRGEENEYHSICLLYTSRCV